MPQRVGQVEAVEAGARVQDLERVVVAVGEVTTVLIAQERGAGIESAATAIGVPEGTDPLR